MVYLVKSFRLAIELCRLKFTYADRRLVAPRLSAASKEFEMRVTSLSLADRNLIVAEAEASRERESEEGNARERGEDEEPGGCVGRSSGRGRGVRRPAGGRERKRRGRAADFGKINRRAGRKLLLLLLLLEKVQCPPLEARYWSGIKGPRRRNLDDLVSQNSPCKGRKRTKGKGREFYYIALCEIY